MTAMPAYHDETATFDDLIDLPEHPHHELIDGVIYAQAKGNTRHQHGAGVLFRTLHELFNKRPGEPGGPGGWVIMIEPELHLNKDALIPDIAGWHRQRFPGFSTTYIEVAPDWVCEVLSPGTERFDRGRKMRIYARNGVRHYWLVDMEEQLLEVYRLEGELYVPLLRAQGDAVGRYQPFDAAELPLEPLWDVYSDEA